MPRKGEMTINGKDAYDMFGAFLMGGALQTLLTPSALKPFVENQSRLQHGKRYILKDGNGNSLIRKTDREITLPICILASDTGSLALRLAALEEELNKGEITLRVKDIPDTVFHLVHRGNPSPSGMVEGMAIFSFKFNEPNPNDRT